MKKLDSMAPEMVAAAFGSNVGELYSDTRKTMISHPRWLVWWLMFHAEGRLKSAIGSDFCRDGSTVRHGIKMAEKRMTVDPAYRDMALGMYDKIWQARLDRSLSKTRLKFEQERNRIMEKY